jgi:CheY-like chemotaxis protein
LRVLIIEDEVLIAMLIEDMLADLGCIVVGIVSTLDDALTRISALGFDAAILDVNLNGAESYPVARVLLHGSGFRSFSPLVMDIAESPPRSEACRSWPSHSSPPIWSEALLQQSPEKPGSGCSFSPDLAFNGRFLRVWCGEQHPRHQRPHPPRELPTIAAEFLTVPRPTADRGHSPPL